MQKLVDAVGADRGIDITELVKIFSTASRFVKLFRDLTPLGGFLTAVSVPAQILSSLRDIGQADLLGIQFLGHKAYAYGVTAWAFRETPPEVPAADLQKLRSWVSGESRVEHAKKIWPQMRDAAVQAMDRASIDDGIPVKYAQMLVSARFDNDRKKLACAVYAAFETGLTPAQREMHRKLSCDYPN